MCRLKILEESKRKEADESSKPSHTQRYSETDHVLLLPTSYMFLRSPDPKAEAKSCSHWREAAVIAKFDVSKRRSDSRVNHDSQVIL